MDLLELIKKNVCPIREIGQLLQERPTISNRYRKSKFLIYLFEVMRWKSINYHYNIVALASAAHMPVKMPQPPGVFPTNEIFIYPAN